MVNDFVNISIDMTLFFADKDYHSRSGVKPLEIYIKRGNTELEHADKIITRIESIRE